jgi:hypothetical protein
VLVVIFEVIATPLSNLRAYRRPRGSRAEPYGREKKWIRRGVVAREPTTTATRASQGLQR